MIRKIYWGIALNTLAVLIFSCTPQPARFELGAWRGVFKSQEAEFPFQFNIVDDTAGTVKAVFINGEERVYFDSIRYERDSVIVPIDLFDAFFIGKLTDQSWNGYFRKRQSNRQGIPFTATPGKQPRFVRRHAESALPIEGKWSVSLINDKGDSRYTVGLFDQRDNTVTGTILTTTGDYRYFEGIADGDSVKLSGFGGSNPSLLQVKLIDSTHITGELYSPTGKTKLIAIKSDTARLPDPYKLTYLKPGYDKFTFQFPDLEGNPVSLEDEKYRNKAVIVTLTGSWCPNCMDETAFLAPWYKANKHRGVEIIALSFERKDDLDFVRERIDKLVKRFDAEYDFLFAGLADKKQAAEKLPALNAVLSFPTTIFIDRTGKVTKIHTGFSGPATGKYYEEFVRDFNEEVNRIVGEENGV
ncbi:MAG: TlpA family protein disulfide reductase [Cyclobacteriaceae bacterium]|nr:TlpA family protein disulfide reductase [Cyclobacteriaceae bacterium]